MPNQERIEGSARIKLFGGLVKIATAAIADLETLWGRYLALVEPQPQRPLPDPATWKSTARAKPRRVSILSRIRVDRAISAAALALLALACLWQPSVVEAARLIAGLKSALEALPQAQIRQSSLLFALFFPLSGPPLSLLAAKASERCIRLFITPDVGRPSRAEVRARRREAECAWQHAASAWQAQPPPPDVSDLRPRIEEVKKDLDALALEREAKIGACAAPIPEGEQRIRHLAGFRIENAKLTNIGPARCAVLRSWGIDTAADVEATKITQIPSFGKNLSDKLILWRERIDKAFVYSQRR